MPDERHKLAGRLRGVLFLGIAAGTVVLDQWTKKLAEDHLLHSGVRSVPVPLIGDYFRLTYVENRGAAFGLLQNQTVLFVAVGVIVIAVIAASHRHLLSAGFPVHLALGLQLGGAIGNLVDRIRQGYVVDFFDFGYQANWWPVFNIADSAIVVGVGLLALSFWNTPHPAERGQPAARPGDAG